MTSEKEAQTRKQPGRASLAMKFDRNRTVAVLAHGNQRRAIGSILGKTTQIDTQNPIGNLRLTVGLRIKCRTEAKHGALEREELLPKGAGA
jgi:hypothetical protein